MAKFCSHLAAAISRVNFLSSPLGSSLLIVIQDIIHTSDSKELEKTLFYLFPKVCSADNCFLFKKNKNKKTKSIPLSCNCLGYAALNNIKQVSLL